MATQMSMLEEKLATLRDGTEAVACVLANWDHVFRAINMASSESHPCDCPALHSRSYSAEVFGELERCGWLIADLQRKLPDHQQQKKKRRCQDTIDCQ